MKRWWFLITEYLIYLCLLASIILNIEIELVGYIDKMLVSFVILILACAAYRTFGIVYKCDQPLSCGCSSVNHLMKKIYNGEPSEKHSWRWMVSLRKIDSGEVNTYSKILNNSCSTHANITIFHYVTRE
jgi:hypothetical protein